MKYQSTRGSKTNLTGAQAIIKGLAEDKGLYVPTEIPTLPKPLKEFQGQTYQEIAFDIIGTFFDDFTKEEMKACIDGAYDSKFEESEIVPLVKAGDAHILELFHGKTAAFKDMALSILPYLLTTSLKKEKEEKQICILTATSGDTGKAALEGFANVEGTEIVVFYPCEGVSQVQERQMVTQEGSNTSVFAIKGNFDDAQTGVKKIFADDDFAAELDKKGIKLSSANSINIGRLVPQVAYYVYGYTKLVESGAIKQGDKINVVVPTGNFGNILAAYYAAQMGVPVNKFICASNENKVLSDFINTGEYNINRAFQLTNSPSMDILISSNLERLLFHLGGGSEEVAALMKDLDEKRVYNVSSKIKEGLSDFYGAFATMDETNDTIAKVYNSEGYLLDTHTAVAYKVYEDYVKETSDPTVTLIASTASPYKFADSVGQSIGIEISEDGFDNLNKLFEKTAVRIPAGLKDLDKKDILHDTTLEVSEMKESILKK